MSTESDRAAGAVPADPRRMVAAPTHEGFARIKVQGAYIAAEHMTAIDSGDREGSSSAGGHGLSPLPANKR